MTQQRPLSPHLQVYKLQLTSMLSILHRATGVALAFGLIMLTWWLAALATDAGAFAQFHDFVRSGCGLFLLGGWAFSLIYHLLNGLRHLMWDTGRGLDLETTYRTGWLVVFGSIIVTIVLLLAACDII